MPILGTSPDAIDLAEDRKRFGALLSELGIPQPESGTATSLREAKRVAARIGYPVLVRPSYVLGGRAMAIVYDETRARGLRPRGGRRLRGAPDPRRPLPRGRLRGSTSTPSATESASSSAGSCSTSRRPGSTPATRRRVLPTYKIAPEHIATIRDYTRKLGLALDVIGLMNVQYAIKDDVVYVLEVNPRASRTTPFVSKATGVPLAKVAARVCPAEPRLAGDRRRT